LGLGSTVRVPPLNVTRRRRRKAINSSDDDDVDYPAAIIESRKVDDATRLALNAEKMPAGERAASFELPAHVWLDGMSLCLGKSIFSIASNKFLVAPQ